MPQSAIPGGLNAFQEALAGTWTNWLLSTDAGKTFPYLAHTQTMTLQMTIGGARYDFPHTTCNCVTKS